MGLGVEAPERVVDVDGVGGARLPLEVEGEGMVFGREEVLPVVALLCKFVVSEEGGSGRWDGKGEEELSVEARHRKHSPVPK